MTVFMSRQCRTPCTKLVSLNLVPCYFKSTCVTMDVIISDLMIIRSGITESYLSRTQPITLHLKSIRLKMQQADHNWCFIFML